MLHCYGLRWTRMLQRDALTQGGSFAAQPLPILLSYASICLFHPPGYCYAIAYNVTDDAT